MSRRHAAMLVLIGACRAAAAPAPSSEAPAPISRTPPSASDGGAPIRFVRAVPLPDARRSVDACAYPSALGSACIDALMREVDDVRAKYMRRVSDAYVRLGVGPKIGAATHAEIAECCNRHGPCGADKRAGHADCPAMDDGYACLTAAEILRSEKQNPAPMHARACRCSWARAQIAVPGGTLACDGPNRLGERGAALTDAEARDALACATCDPERGPDGCGAEVERLHASDPAVARFIERVIVTRCQLP